MRFPRRIKIPDWGVAMLIVMLLGCVVIVVGGCFVALTYVVFHATPPPLQFWDYMARFATVFFDISGIVSVLAGCAIKFDW